jgi:hypothetical protein
LASLDDDLQTIQKRIVLASTESITNRDIARTIGYVEFLSEIEAVSDSDYRVAERDALLGLSKKALACGANAIIGLRKTSAHYDQAGSRWRVSRIAYAGTAVVVVP